jgi:hypothetical protein
MRLVGQFLLRFWVAALALSILLPVLSLIDAVKLARKTWGWWHRNPDTPELLTAICTSSEPAREYSP